MKDDELYQYEIVVAKKPVADLFLSKERRLIVVKEKVDFRLLYSELKAMWHDDELIKWPFPMEAIDRYKMRMINNWEIFNSNLLVDGKGRQPLYVEFEFDNMFD